MTAAEVKAFTKGQKWSRIKLRMLKEREMP